MQKNNYLRKTLALVMAFLMIVTMMPVNVFAEVAPANWTDDNQEARYWPIPNQGRIVKVSSAEPLKNPSLRYIGGYTRPDGREVVRLAFSGYSGAVTDVWLRLILKPDKELNDLIDWDKSGMGKKRTEQFTNNHDGYNFNKEWTKFKPMSAMQGGSGNLHVMDIGDTGTMTVRTGLLGVHFETPIDLVLKKDKTVKSLQNNPLIQMRLMDSNYEQIYSTTITENQAIPYSSYTMSTFIPVRVNLKAGVLNTDVIRNTSNKFQAASSYIKYNEEKGYIDVYTRRTHGTVTSTMGGDNFGFRQTFDISFKEILKSQDVSGTVARIFTANEKDAVNNPTEDPTIPQPGNRIDYSINDIKEDKVNKVGVVEVSNNNPNDTFMTTGTNLTGYGDSTVVRYFIDKEKLLKKFGGTDIVSYEFFSTLFIDNKEGVEEFRSNSRDQDINLKRGDKIRILFDARRDATIGTMDQNGSYIQIGDDQFAISIRTTADKTSYSGGLITWNPKYMREIEVSVPFDIKIKKDTPVTIFSRKSNNQKVSPGMKVTFAYSDLDDEGNTIVKEKDYRFERPLIEGYTRNADGEIFYGNEKINNSTDSLFIDNHKPLVVARQENFGGGILTKTVDVPDVDEIFTDSEQLTGRSKYDSANVYLYDADKQKVGTAKRLGAITATSQKIKMNVNGDEVQGFEWTSGSNDVDKKIDPKLWEVKDTPLYITNQDVLQIALENEKPVVEQVQAKVTFDLNQGTMPLDVKSYQGVDSTKLPGTEFAYNTQRSSQNQPVVRIAPMNENYANAVGYTPNGFEGNGATYKDHNGGDLTGDALELRKFVDVEPKFPGRTFLGWTTKKLTGTAEAVTNAYTALTEATTADQVNGDENFIFTKTSPITKTMRVYAAFGSQVIKFHTNPPADLNKTDEVVLQNLTDQNLTDSEVTLNKNYNNEKFQMEGYSLVGYSVNKNATEPDENITGEGLNKDNYLRDGDRMPLTPEQELNGVELYAVWKKNYTVDVTKVWEDAALKTANENRISIGLLARPAVGVQGEEVVHQGAVYRPVKGTVKALSEAENGKLVWTNLKSYDENGHRMSYIAVELTASTIKKFNEESIKYDDYGVTIVSADEDPRGIAHKEQLINTDGVDAMSGATMRKHYNSSGQPVNVHAKGVNMGYFDTYGYSIILTNTKVDVKPPKIDEIKYDATQVIVRKVGDPSKIVTTLPDGKTVIVVKDASGTYIFDQQKSTFKGTVNVDTEGVITIKTGKMTPGQVVKAQQFKAVGNQEKDSEVVKATVQPQPVSAKVEEFKQLPKDDKGNVGVEFVVPNPKIDPPKAGTDYQIGYMDGDNFVPIGDKVTLDKDIVSDSDTDVKKILTIPANQLDNIKKKNLVIRASEPNKVPANSDKVDLDLIAPTADAKAADELWRRWVNVDLSNFVEGTKRIIVKYKDINGDQILRLNTLEETKATIEMLQREGFTNLDISIEDKFGNAEKLTPSYAPTKVIQIMVRNPRIGRDHIYVRAYQVDTTVTVRIYDEQYAEAVRDRTPGYENKAKATGQLKLTDLKYTKINLQNGYKLQKNDVIEIIGTTDDGGRTNPYVTKLR